jgi:hypothetical protein
MISLKIRVVVLPGIAKFTDLHPNSKCVKAEDDGENLEVLTATMTALNH